MAKLVLQSVATGYQSIDALNANFTALTAAFDNTLSRDGTSPNAMLANLDMNSQRVVNLPAPATSTEPLRLSDVGLLGTLAVTLLAGQLYFGTGTGLAQDSNLFWDNTNKQLQTGLGTQALPGFAFAGDADTGLWRRTPNVLTLSTGGSSTTEFQSSVVVLGSASTIKWGDATSIPAIGAFDTGISRTSAGVLEVNNGTPGTLATLKALAVLAASVGSGSGVTTLLTAGAAALNFDSTQFSPIADNVLQLGTNATRFSKLFTPVIDTGTGGSLSVRTNNGAEQFRISHTASSVDFLHVSGSISGRPQIGSSFSASANSGIDFLTKGTGTYDFYTRTDVASKLQFQIIDTASATRNITVTGSNGGNPTIGVTAGSLAITPAVVMASTLQIGGGLSGVTTLSLSGAQSGGTTLSLAGPITLTTAASKIIPGATSLSHRNNADNADNLLITDAGLVTVRGTLTVGNGHSVPSNGNIAIGATDGAAEIRTRNNANSGDVLLVQLATQVANDVVFVGVGSSGVYGRARSGSAAPTTTDLPASNWTIWRDTVGATTKLYYNNAGTIQSVALA